MDRLEIRVVLAVAAARAETEASNQSAGGVRKDITIEARQDDDIHLFRFRNETARKIIDQPVLILDIWIFFRHARAHLAEQARPVRG